MRKGTAYRKNKELRKRQKEQVFDFIKASESVTTYDLYKAMNFKQSSVTGRLSELEQEGLIYQKGKFIPEIGRPCTTWGATPSELIEARKNENWNKRLTLWLQKGKNNGFVTNKELNQLKAQHTLF